MFLFVLTGNKYDDDDDTTMPSKTKAKAREGLPQSHLQSHISTVLMTQMMAV